MNPSLPSFPGSQIQMIGFKQLQHSRADHLHYPTYIHLATQQHLPARTAPLTLLLSGSPYSVPSTVGMANYMLGKRQGTPIFYGHTLMIRRRHMGI